MSSGKRALKRLQTMEAGEDLLAGDLAHDVQANTESDVVLFLVLASYKLARFSTASRVETLRIFLCLGYSAEEVCQSECH